MSIHPSERESSYVEKNGVSCMNIGQIAARQNGRSRINSCVKKVETQGNINKLKL